MQISPVIMRLLVISSIVLAGLLSRNGVAHAGTIAPIVSLSSAAAIAADSGKLPPTSRRLPDDEGPVLIVKRRPPGATLVSGNTGSFGGGQPRQRSIQDVGSGSQSSSVMMAEKNVYRTKLSKLKIILLADLMNDFPKQQQLELITCLANSSSLNVTTKHCDCESYNCKDLPMTSSSAATASVSSSGPSPFNSVQQQQRKIHTSCGDYCCRKKKFNRSIDPALQNSVNAVFRAHYTPAPAIVSSLQFGESLKSRPPTPYQHQQQHQAPVILIRKSSIKAPALISKGAAATTAMTSGITSNSSTALAGEVLRDKTHRWNCEGSSANHQIAISTLMNGGSGETPSTGSSSQQQEQEDHFRNRVPRTPELPWLWRVVLIEKEMTICAGTLIHPRALLTTAVCVINKNPDQLIVRRQSYERIDPIDSLVGVSVPFGKPGDNFGEVYRNVDRIIIPDQYAKTFERLENNVALLVLQSAEDKQHRPLSMKQQQHQRPFFESEPMHRLRRTFQDITSTASSSFSSSSQATSPSESSRSFLPVDARKRSESHQDADGSAVLLKRLLLDRNPEDKPSSRQQESSSSGSYICLSSIINYPSTASLPTSSSSSSRMSNICQTYSWKRLEEELDGSREMKLPRKTSPPTPTRKRKQQRFQRRQQRRQQRLYQSQSQSQSQNQQMIPTPRSGHFHHEYGTNYITANISIFPANSSECRREHWNYLRQHPGNLCAAPADSRIQNLDVDLSGSPLICTRPSADGRQATVELSGLLTWSTDINRSPHLFTNVATYRNWIDTELDKLDRLDSLRRIDDITENDDDGVPKTTTTDNRSSITSSSLRN
ncbi:uncharacterized protein LOC129744692 [Uranotaenia lowii]|uniref:uncharacterized protein LOC129744692 n=1 Tax=Uranotaenia lowii TaxID=190385 RepID=UPI00247A2655|nr:uncharacterized protein LOC129744692 [Uranotaenia lowii]XP_055593312.1 uncharacterized protein LOC129744692 [Uranotaenia lowii]XP_055593313.1 uncharacterized protein LOC129744692 [Uranotaenia lowii]XP_055593315.1 uncharacterized protein LOC129744692 [Uranotaenia lowii]XP_055593316.1 uncharacterized protein LOC129744692 [Uranotaenia lowii]